MSDSWKAGVLEAIKAGCVRAAQIEASPAVLALPVPLGRGGRMRAVDRALQALRRGGLIRFDTRKGWTVR